AVVGAELRPLVRAAGRDACVRTDGASAQAGRLVTTGFQLASLGSQDPAAHAGPARIDEGLSRCAADLHPPRSLSGGRQRGLARLESDGDLLRSCRSEGDRTRVAAQDAAAGRADACSAQADTG